MSRLATALAAAVLLAPSLAFAAWTRQGEGELTFDAKGNIGMKFHGVTKAFTVADDGTALTIAANVADLDTDNSLRNKHMQEDLEASKFPALSLAVPLAALKVPADGANIEAEAKGTFTLHGQAVEVPFTYKASCAAGACAVEASAKLNVNDFGVKIRSYLGVTVKPEVTIGAKFSLKR